MNRCLALLCAEKQQSRKDGTVNFGCWHPQAVMLSSRRLHPPNLTQRIDLGVLLDAHRMRVIAAGRTSQHLLLHVGAVRRNIFGSKDSWIYDIYTTHTQILIVF